jgi:hypothetical protein
MLAPDMGSVWMALEEHLLRLWLWLLNNRDAKCSSGPEPQTFRPQPMRIAPNHSACIRVKNGTVVLGRVRHPHRQPRIIVLTIYHLPPPSDDEFATFFEERYAPNFRSNCAADTPVASRSPRFWEPNEFMPRAAVRRFVRCKQEMMGHLPIGRACEELCQRSAWRTSRDTKLLNLSAPRGGFRSSFSNQALATPNADQSIH